MKEVKKYLDLPYNYIIQPRNDEIGFNYYARVLVIHLKRLMRI